MEVSLWICQQFASDLRLFFPTLRVVAISSNQLIDLTAPLGHHVLFSGSPSIRKEQLKDACCLFVSQSSQTYPTLAAMKVMSSFMLTRLWLLTGAESSEMASNLKMAYRRNHVEYHDNRVIMNQSGYRPAEPDSVAVISSYHTLSHILLRLIAYQGDAPVIVQRELESMLRLTLPSDASNICGVSASGEKIFSSIHDSLVKEGKHYGRHVSEYWNVLLMAACYILVTVVLDLPIVNVIANLLIKCIMAIVAPYMDEPHHVDRVKLWYDTSSHLMKAIFFFVTLADAFFYIYMGKLFAWLLRLCQGRSLGARLGTRTLIIVDYPCINQVCLYIVDPSGLWLFFFCFSD